MPHLVILYTPNVELDTGMLALCRQLAACMLGANDEGGRQVVPDRRHARAGIPRRGSRGGGRRGRLRPQLNEPADEHRAQRCGQEASGRNHLGAHQGLPRASVRAPPDWPERTSGRTPRPGV
uniref:5-carboxymethyl-2-hydroxymuconic acid isomerase n=1 Tax=Pseudomonas sp. DJ-12 TaxID=74138 RepID=Q93A26_9PROT|nr:5-carboxymethyl-2-hydroxymuconic acid isomerase [Pseudomonas sp. DJ-12]